MIENQQILYHKKPLPKKLLNLGLLLFVVGLLGTIAGFFCGLGTYFF